MRKIDHPTPAMIPCLKKLWQEAFGDSEEYIACFFDTAFSPLRCRCVTEDGQLAAALYWLDCQWGNRKVAYIYAVATAKAMRGQGLCRTLMGDTHSLLARLGYAGCILCPGNAGLFGMYRTMGYEKCTSIREFFQAAGTQKADMREINAAEYARLRRQMLPEDSVLQEGENLAFLGKLYRFWAGEDFLLCAAQEKGNLFGAELLGNPAAAPGILAALGASEGTFRTPGKGKDFTMYHPLTDAPAPNYLGFAFD